jgi:ATPase subunit of ABC transporter with duplicated ATPase domains
MALRWRASIATDYPGDGVPILQDASAAILPGAKVGLVGRNGSGKSTLLRALIGQIELDAGAIEMPRRTRLGYRAGGPQRQQDSLRNGP